MLCIPDLNEITSDDRCILQTGLLDNTNSVKTSSSSFFTILRLFPDEIDNVQRILELIWGDDNDPDTIYMEYMWKQYTKDKLSLEDKLELYIMLCSEKYVSVIRHIDMMRLMYSATIDELFRKQSIPPSDYVNIINTPNAMSISRKKDMTLDIDNDNDTAKSIQLYNDTIATNIVLCEASTNVLQQEVANHERTENDRLDILSELYSRYEEKNEEFHHDTPIKRIEQIYIITNLEIDRRFLTTFCLSDRFPLSCRFECASMLFENVKSHETGYRVFIQLLETSNWSQFADIPIETIVAMLYRLLKEVENASSCNLLVSEHRMLLELLADKILCSNQYPIEYRYRTLLSLESNISTDDMRFAVFEFLVNVSNDIRFRLLCSQYIFEKEVYRNTWDAEYYEMRVHDYSHEFVQDIVMRIANNIENIANIRADACDILIRYGNASAVSLASTILESLEYDEEHTILATMNVYENRQNAHAKHLNAKVLSSYAEIEEELRAGNAEYSISNFETVAGKIREYARMFYRLVVVDFAENVTNTESEKDDSVTAERCESEEVVMTALKRIEFDRASYSHVKLLDCDGNITYTYSLQNALCLIYDYIHSEGRVSIRNELIKRLLEELTDMSGTCSTGYITRIFNVLSGYTEFQLQISWDEQISANLSGRLNRKLQDDKNCDAIVSELIATNISDKKVFLGFFRKHISSIKEEMYHEFREYMSDTDWDLCFQKALLHYDCA